MIATHLKTEPGKIVFCAQFRVESTPAATKQVLCFVMAISHYFVPNDIFEVGMVLDKLLDASHAMCVSIRK